MESKNYYQKPVIVIVSILEKDLITASNEQFIEDSEWAIDEGDKGQ